MKIEELIEELEKIKERQDLQTSKGELCGNFDDDHIEADELLLEYINNQEVIEIFESIEKWYS
jgi:hypothetical protein